MIEYGANPALDLICAVLRGESPTWLAGADELFAERFLAAADTHLVGPLLHSRFAAGALTGTWPPSVLDACRQDSPAQAAREMAHRREVAVLLAALGSAGIVPIVLKGTALAYSHYENPAHRPRCDSDLLLPPGTAEKAAEVLACAGFVRSRYAPGELASSQSTWSKVDRLGLSHDIDVHQRLSNWHVIAEALSYDELKATAAPLHALAPEALAPSAVHSLLFACMHRAGHLTYDIADEAFLDGDHLIWLYDMHLLLRRMSAGEVAEFVALARTKRMSAICRDALQRTQACFGTAIPEDALDLLGRSNGYEPSASHLGGRRWQLMLSDFIALRRWDKRLTWLRELAFPPADHMRRKYQMAGHRPLALLYLDRAAGGLQRVLRPAAKGHRH